MINQQPIVIFTCFSSLPFYLFVFLSIPEKFQDHFQLIKVKIKKYDCMITVPKRVIFLWLSEIKEVKF